MRLIWLTLVANFIAFLKEVKIPTSPTDMTFGVSRDQGLFEWSGTSLSAVFAQKSNFFDPRMWQMIFDIVRFNQFALDLLSVEDESEIDISGANGAAENVGKPAPQQSIGEYLDREGYSDAFRNDYLIPMTASVWSTSPDKASLEFPAITLIRFMWNHHLLTTVAARPTWMTIVGGSKQYIDAVMRDFPEHNVHLDTVIESLSVLENEQLAVHRMNGKREIFDHVILATHGDQAMDIIRNIATPEEEEIMSSFKTSKNSAVLHSDRSVCIKITISPEQSTDILKLMPKRYVAWSSWNYITTSPSSNTAPSVCLTYWMNLLQHIPSFYGMVLVTLNPLHPPKSAQGSWTYHHPLYNAAAIRSQKLLPRIQNTRGISYAGAWTKYGFHEDGFSSGLKVAVEHLGAKLPFDFVDSTFSRGRRPVLGWMDRTLRGCIYMIQLIVVLIGQLFALVSRRAIRNSDVKKTQ